MKRTLFLTIAVLAALVPAIAFAEIPLPEVEVAGLPVTGYIDSDSDGVFGNTGDTQYASGTSGSTSVAPWSTSVTSSQGVSGVVLELTDADWTGGSTYSIEGRFITSGQENSGNAGKTVSFWVDVNEDGVFGDSGDTKLTADVTTDYEGRYISGSFGIPGYPFAVVLNGGTPLNTVYDWGGATGGYIESQ